MISRRRDRNIPTTFSDEGELFSSQDSCGNKRAKVSTQEFGQMMEHIDEVLFAVDGLRKGQQPRVIRASLLSLLSICASPHRRQLLRTQRMTKTITDAILSLSLDDSPSNLASAALFYILTIEGQDDHLLESPRSIQFLIKLLRPIVSLVSEDKALKFRSPLLALQKSAGILKNTLEVLDSCSVAIVSRVREILVNCEELKLTGQSDCGLERPELCPKWLALLIIEKACSSAVSLDETSGALQKTGENFKEKLRKLGGLDAVFETMLNCLSDLEIWMEDSSRSTKDMRNDKQLQSLTLLLKCMKIMENATFRSKDNQTHLLGLKRKLSSRAIPFSFVELVVTLVKILSDLFLNQSSSATSNECQRQDPFSMRSHDSNLDLLTDHKENKIARDSSMKSFNLSLKSQLSKCSQLKRSLSISETPRTSMTRSAKSCTIASSGSDCKTSMTEVDVLDNSQDPFAFDEDDSSLSRWDLLSGKQKKSHSKKYERTNREFEDGRQSQTNGSQKVLNNKCSSSSISDGAGSSLLADCLLTAVKVLMNLTNENPAGCQQIAAYGGLETMPLLIAGHFPSFSSLPLSFGNTSKIPKDHQHDRHLTDHELDFLVAILGLLVNLVEKDGHNRSRLAAASVLLPTSKGLGQAQRGVIQLLCSIFLANQGGGDGVEEDKCISLDDIDEAAILQGEKEAEKMIVEAYSALLLAFLSTESKSVRKAISDNLPHHSLSILVPVLDRFVDFHFSMNMISSETYEAVCEIIESCKVT